MNATPRGSTGPTTTAADENGGASIDLDFPIDPVPPSHRRSFFSIAVVLLGFTIFVPTMMAGAAIGPSFSFPNFLVVLVLGSAVLGGYVAAIGWLGAKTGLTSVVMNRYAFGTGGAKLASLLLGGTQVGWFGVVVGSIGELTAQAFGWSGWGPRAIVMVIVAALMIVTAAYGYEGMYWVSLISTPLILILAFWVCFRAVDHSGGISGLWNVQPATAMGLGAAITTIVGTFASAGTQAANWTRFARSGSQAAIAAIIGFAIGNGLMIFFGAIGAISYQQADFIVLLLDMGLIFWALFLLFGNYWKSNADAAYAFGVAGAEMFNKASKLPYIVGGGIIGTVLALTGVHQHIISYLVLLGVFIPPVGGVLLGDHLARWTVGRPAPRDFVGPVVRWQGMVAYGVAALVAYISNERGWGVPPVQGILIALVLAYILGRQESTVVTVR